METGFRFNPTDEELIKILERKVTGQKMPLHDHFILERNVYELDPRELQWNHTVYLSNNERYCYYTRETDSREVIGRGWWRATGHVKKVYADQNQQVVGYKRPLTFLKFTSDETKRKNAFKTKWIMHEYSIEGILTEWRLCKIKYKGKASLKEEIQIRKSNTLRDIIDFEANSSMVMQPGQEQQQPQPLLENVNESYNEVGSSIIDLELDFVVEEKQQLQPLKLDNQVYDPYNYSEASSSMGMHLDFVGERAEQQPAKALEPDNQVQNIQMEEMDEQQLNSSFDPILTDISSSNYYFDGHQDITLEKIFPTLWSW